jgi:hypothetical protein
LCNHPREDLIEVGGNQPDFAIPISSQLQQRLVSDCGPFPVPLGLKNCCHGGPHRKALSEDAAFQLI